MHVRSGASCRSVSDVRASSRCSTGHSASLQHVRNSCRNVSRVTVMRYETDSARYAFPLAGHVLAAAAARVLLLVPVK